jgi:hypothetical protein
MFPVIATPVEVPVPENMEELTALWKKSTGHTPVIHYSASKMTAPSFEHGFPHGKRAGDDASKREIS